MHAPIVIYGPTGSGKTALSLELAMRHNGEIVNMDSRQIYQGMDIGTGKIRQEEMQGIPHHLLDIIRPDQAFSVGAFSKLAIPCIEDIIARGKTPILCGGTGLYIDAAIFLLDIPPASEDLEYRKELEELAEKQGNDAVWNILAEQDPEYAKELHANNLHYVIRALEVLKCTGKSKTAYRTKRTLRYPETTFITPYDDSKRKILYERIDARVHGMFEEGLIKEVQWLIDTFGPNIPGLGTIGYTEVVDYLLGRPQYRKIPPTNRLEEFFLDATSTEALVAMHNRNYAKRQISWNKRYEAYPHRKLGE